MTVDNNNLLCYPENKQIKLNKTKVLYHVSLQGDCYRVCFMSIVWQALKNHFISFFAGFIYFTCKYMSRFWYITLWNFYLYNTICSFKFSFKPSKGHFQRQNNHPCENLILLICGNFIFPVKVSGEGFELSYVWNLPI